MKHNFKIEFIVACVVIGGLLVMLAQQCSDKRSYERKFNVTNKALKISVNKLNQQTAEFIPYVEKYNNLMAVDAGKDSLILRIQKEADEKLQFALAFNSQTIMQHRGSTQVLIPVQHTGIYRDTGLKDPDQVRAIVLDSNCTGACDSTCPEYFYSEKSEDDSVSVISNCQQTIVNYIVYNNFDIKQSWKRKGLFGREDYVSITNRNPHTVTLDARAFKLEATKPKRLLWFGAGVTFTLAGMLYLYSK